MRATLTSLLFAAACFSGSSQGIGDDGEAGDQGGAGGISGEASGGAPPPPTGGPLTPAQLAALSPTAGLVSDFVPATPSLCGGVECAAHHECCFVDATCVPTGGCGFTPMEVDEPGGNDTYRTCGSNSHCPDDEMCYRETCMGPGVCRSRTDCGRCDGDGDGRGCQVCGCDGADYPNPQTACYLGVTAHAAPSMCGSPTVLTGTGGTGAEPDTFGPTYCGSDSQCSARGEVCCGWSGECVDGSDPYLCGEPPERTERRCTLDAHCTRPGTWCKIDVLGCEPGEGGCIEGERGPGCFAALHDPVCACDGHTYTSAKCALANIASYGECDS